MGNYALKLTEYGLSKEEYEELKWFCRQYPRKKQMLSYLLNPAHQIGIEEYKDEHGRLCGTAMPRGNKTSDPTLAAVSKREALLKDCQIIEQAAIATDSTLYQQLMRNVTMCETYERINPACGRRQFFETRRKFFFVLWSLRNNTISIQNGTLTPNT
jgi:hypothetical protein